MNSPSAEFPRMCPHSSAAGVVWGVSRNKSHQLSSTGHWRWFEGENGSTHGISVPSGIWVLWLLKPVGIQSENKVYVHLNANLPIDLLLEVLSAGMLAVASTHTFSTALVPNFGRSSSKSNELKTTPGPPWSSSKDTCRSLHIFLFKFVAASDLHFGSSAHNAAFLAVCWKGVIMVAAGGPIPDKYFGLTTKGYEHTGETVRHPDAWTIADRSYHSMSSFSTFTRCATRRALRIHFTPERTLVNNGLGET
ncbi:hypothetical protein K474DRAFT_1677085 [Panus rudis PR-1116 ss-1]|nr:hypothetical protein K474DRAFT_1677085 [Panus rudis PR-1116 ss-1]